MQVAVTIIAQAIPLGIAIRKLLKINFTSIRIGNRKIVETILRIRGFFTFWFMAIT